jgi:hypothetical protein
MPKLQRKFKKPTKNVEDSSKEDDFPLEVGSKAPTKRDSKGKALDSRKPDKRKKEIAEDNSEAENAKETTGSNAPRTRPLSTGNAQISNTVDESTTLDRKKKNKNKNFLIPRFNPDEENPLSLLKPLSPEMAQRIAQQSFEEPMRNIHVLLLGQE